MALVRNQLRAAGIRAATDCWCLSLPRQHLLTLMKTEAGVRDSILATMSKIEDRERAGH